MAEPTRSKPEHLWAFVDSGGLVAAVMPGVGVVPLVSNRESVVQKMEPFARQHAITHQKPVSLVRYAIAQVLHTIEGSE